MSATLETALSSPKGSSGAPISDSRPAGDGVTPLGTAETTILPVNSNGGARTVNVGFCNISGGATSITVYLKPTAATVAADANTIVKGYAMPTTGDPVIFQALQGLVVPGDYVLTGLVTVGAASSANAFVSGVVQR